MCIFKANICKIVKANLKMGGFMRVKGKELKDMILEKDLPPSVSDDVMYDFRIRKLIFNQILTCFNQ